MLDTMTFTKALGSVCGALLILLLGKWVAEEVYHVGGHKGEEQAYVIETGDDEAPAEEVAEVPFEEVYAVADAGDGEGLWRQCRSCHQLEQGENRTGPYLYGVVGRDKGSVADFNYSGNLGEGVWSPENLNAFLTNPRDYAPGTSMSYAGMRDIEDRANLIAYLATIGN